MEKSYNELVKHFPKLYKRYGKVEPDRPFYSIEGFGIECWLGWYDLLFETSKKLEDYINSLPETEQDHYYALQVKEKYAQLDINMSGYTDEIFDIVQEAHDKSATICEKCGAPGRLCGVSWYFTLCEDCEKERVKERGGMPL
jgi:hypothetical protein